MSVSTFSYPTPLAHHSPTPSSSSTTHTTTSSGSKSRKIKYIPKARMSSEGELTEKNATEDQYKPKRRSSDYVRKGRGNEMEEGVIPGAPDLSRRRSRRRDLDPSIIEKAVAGKTEPSKIITKRPSKASVGLEEEHRPKPRRHTDVGMHSSKSPTGGLTRHRDNDHYYSSHEHSTRRSPTKGGDDEEVKARKVTRGRKKAEHRNSNSHRGDVPVQSDMDNSHGEDDRASIHETRSQSPSRRRGENIPTRSPVASVIRRLTHSLSPTGNRRKAKLRGRRPGRGEKTQRPAQQRRQSKCSGEGEGENENTLRSRVGESLARIGSSLPRVSSGNLLSRSSHGRSNEEILENFDWDEEQSLTREEMECLEMMYDEIEELEL